MFQEPIPGINTSEEELEFIEKHGLKTQKLINEYFTDCPYCNYPYLYIYMLPTVIKNEDTKFASLCCYCNECQITGPLNSIRKDIGYEPFEGVKRFIFECQSYYNDNVSEIAKTEASLRKHKNFPSDILLSKIGVKDLYEEHDYEVLKQFKGFLGYTTRGLITRYRSDGSLTINQRIPYDIPAETWGLMLPFGPEPGFHVGFVMIYEGFDDIEIYVVREKIYTANGRDNRIFFNYPINNSKNQYDTIKEASEVFLNRMDENDIEIGVSVLVTKYLDPIDPMKQKRKVVKNRFGRGAYKNPRKTAKKKLKTTKASKTTKKVTKQKPQEDQSASNT